MRHRRGFTLLELLVVMSIIVILMSLLIPTIAKIRQQAHATATKAQITSLSSVMQAYHGDFSAYPGPVPNSQLGVPGPYTGTPPGCGITPASVPNIAQMSMAENVYLGLCGGLEPVPAVAGQFQFVPAKSGNGPTWMGATPKKLPKYADNVDLSQGSYRDSNDTPALDTAIPEFIDKFPEPMPLLIFRARVGAAGVASASNLTTAGASPQQYDLEQINSYTATEIGVGKKLGSGEVKNQSPPTPYRPFHGLQTVNPNATIGPPPPPPPGGLIETYPYDLYAALIDPTITRVATTPATPANSPRQKDGYIIISAGIDRVYGTPDDIANFDRY